MAVRPSTGRLRREWLAADALANRAWRAAYFGTVLMPPLLNLYSIRLLVILGERYTRISHRSAQRIAWAWMASIVMLLLAAPLRLLFLRATASTP